MIPQLPSPHGDKLIALLDNPKLPPGDKREVQQAIARYRDWLDHLSRVQGPYEIVVGRMVELLNGYKRYIELELIFDSGSDFLYRQKGQIKLDNTIIEEFLPILVEATLGQQLRDYDLWMGPGTCFSGGWFDSSLVNSRPGGGLQVRAKDHDFAIGRELYIQASHINNFTESTTTATSLAYVAAECKTNLDKTMFQEAAATALDIKLVVPGAKYFLLCEWLDMTPISTGTTAIDEVIVLRQARRLPAEIRRQFNTVQGRQANRGFFVNHLDSHPLTLRAFKRFTDHIRNLISRESEEEVLQRGYF